MKKLLLIAFGVFLVTTQLSAQTEKGRVMVGGELLLLGRSGNTTFSASPNVGYFFFSNGTQATNFLRKTNFSTKTSKAC